MSATAGQSAACPGCGKEVWVRVGEFLIQCSRCRKSLRVTRHEDAVALSPSEFEPAAAEPMAELKPRGSSTVIWIALLCLGGGLFRYQDGLRDALRRQASASPSPAPAAIQAPVWKAPAVVAAAVERPPASLPVCVAVMPGATPKAMAYFKEGDRVTLRASGEIIGEWKLVSVAAPGATLLASDPAVQDSRLHTVPAPVLPAIIYTGMMQLGPKRLSTFANVADTIAVGQRVKGATVLAIEPTSVKIEYQGKRFELPCARERPDLARSPARSTPLYRTAQTYTPQVIFQQAEPAPAAQPEPAAPDYWAEAAAKNREKARNGPFFNCRHCNEQVAAETFICPHCKFVARNF